MSEEFEAARYLRACRDPFWQQVFAAELAYLRRHLRTRDRILSVGCGPAIIEYGLSELGFAVVGLDVSPEALARAPAGLGTVAAPAEQLPFADAAFDVALYIVSLQFIEGYRQALAETVRVLRPGGRILVMLLNPASAFFKGKAAEADSYVGKIRHTDLGLLETAMAANFRVHSEYFLGIAGQRIFASDDPQTAALYVIRGEKTEPAEP
jgi:ubiquinone/menaquinone biosynthesis C-methylase UbiE